MVNDVHPSNTDRSISGLKRDRKLLLEEIERIAEYNVKWRGIQNSASTEDAVRDAARAIENNEAFLAQRRVLVDEIDSYIASVTLTAKVRRIYFMDIPLANKLYGNGAVEIEGSAIRLRFSPNLITRSTGGECTITAGEVTNLTQNNLSFDFTVAKLGQFTVELTSKAHFFKLQERLLAYCSDEEKAEQVAKEDFQQRVKPVEKPSATWCLLTLNILVFGLMLLQGYGIFSSESVLAVQWGANFGPLTLGGEWWRLVAAMFLHFGIIHLSMNMLLLYQNSIVESLFGTKNYLLIFLISGVAGNLVSLWYNPWKIGAGASGAIFGLCGSVTALALVARLHLPYEFKRLLIKSFMFFFVINGAVAYFVPQIDLAAHIGGFIAGLALGALFSESIFKEVASKSDIRTSFYALSGLAGFCTLTYFGIYLDEKMQSERPIQLGNFYLFEARSASAKKDYKSALNFAKLSSDLENRGAPNLVGYLIDNGLGVETNRHEAIEWFKLGAQRGDPWATENLAYAYAEERPRKVSEYDVLKLFIDAARLGKSGVFNEIQIRIINFSAIGPEGYANLKSIAAYVDTLASEQSPSMLGLKGWMVFSGFGYPQSNVEGERLIQKAFDLGDARSAEVLGLIYQMGKNRPKNSQVAFEFFSIGAKRGDSRSMYRLGIAYRDGLGVSQDKEQAIFWFKKATSLGESSARTELDALTSLAKE